MHERELVEQIAEMLGVGGAGTEAKLREIRSRLFMEMYCEPWLNNPLELREQWPWIQEVFDEHPEARRQFERCCKDYDNKHHRSAT